MITCAYCEKKIKREDAYPIEFKKGRLRWLCEGCYSDDFAEPIAIVVIYENGERINKGIIGNYNYYAEDWSHEDLISEYGHKLLWKSTDSWRGYYQGKLRGFTCVIDSWFGSVDGYFPDEDVENFHRKIEIEQDYPEFLMVVAFPRTSNVCSCGIEVWVEKGKKREFERWLRR